MKKALGIVFAILLASSAGFAQETVSDEEFGVSVNVPESWEVVDDNDRAVFNFKQSDSHSQVEVIGTQLMTADVADVFFDTFHETLQSSDFLQIGREEKQYAPYGGTETIYSFTHSGVTLKVAVFQFVHDTTAWLAVGYMQEDVFDEHATTYRGVISSLAFAE